ncbi:hypothetical protein QIS74_07108 [Colletotrichum tabaci]|uniref:Metallo-beta-lactamase domain-containing protein n=1 Tax=Colletotrichum tabaci TaxID=1209068 RepID=A0AAV9TA99_9PEZI
MLYLAAFVSGVLGVSALLSREGGATPDPRALLEQGIEALGGAVNIAQVHGVTYSGSKSYRTKTLMQSFSLDGVDRGVSVLGTQDVSFSFDGPQIKQRLRVDHQLDGFWSGFSRPNLDHVGFTIIIQGGDDGFAAVTEGNRNMFDPSAGPQGYVDGVLAAYLIKEANKMSPFLISKILANNNFTYREEALWTSERLHGVYDGNLDLTVLFDPETSLPYAIRSAENHDIFGPSTNDLVMYDYIDSNGVKFPTGWKTFYNGRHLLMTSGVSQVLVNPSFATGFFDGPSDRSRLEKPRRSPQQDFSEVGERSGVYIWLGPFAMTAANISASQPLPELPGLWYLQIGNARPTYRQVVLVLEDSVIVMDSPPHQSLLVLEWIEQTIGRKVIHVWPTHHHHDHSSGLKDYVNAGAKVIVPVEAKPYYSAITGIEFLTFTL